MKQNDAIKVLERLHGTLECYMIDAGDLQFFIDKDCKTIRTALEQVQEDRAAVRGLANRLNDIHKHNMNMGEVGLMSDGEYISWDLGEAYSECKMCEDIDQALTTHAEAIKRARAKK